MPHSFASLEEFTCSTCSQPFPAEVWLIVEAVERPDLLTRIRTGTLHVVPCPHCQQTIRVAAPLFVFAATGRLLFVSAAPDGHDLSHALDLAMAQLNANLPAWMDQMEVVALPELVSAMGDNDAVPDGALPATDALEQTFFAFMDAESWDEAQQLVEAHPELLTDAADTLLTGLIAHATAHSDSDALALLTMNQALLRRCRAVGIPRTFAEQILPAEALAEADRLGVAPEDFLAQLEAQAMMPAELQEVLAELAGRGVAIHSEADLEQALAEHPELAARLTALAGNIAELIIVDEDDGNPFATQLRSFVAAESWDESRGIVEEHPELLSDEAEAMIEAALTQQRAQGDAEAVQLLIEHLALLRRCRAVGIPRAFAEKMLSAEALAEAEQLGMTPEEFLALLQAQAEMPPELQVILVELAARGVEIHSEADLEQALADHPDLAARLAAWAGEELPVPPALRDDFQRAKEAEQRYLGTGDCSALDASIAVWTRILQHPEFQAADQHFHLMVYNDAGGTYLRRFWVSGQEMDLAAALDLWQQAVDVTPSGSPDLPMYLNNLGNGLSTRFGRTGSLGDLDAAIRVYQQAVAATPPGSPAPPSILCNLGNGLRIRFGRTGSLDDLEAALQFTQQAIDATPPGSPDLPMYLNNLGAGLSTRFGRTGSLGDLEAAIRVYQQAVAATPPDSPNLPSILSNLGSGLRDHFGRTGQMDDLDAALRLYQQAVTATPSGSHTLPGILTNLGTGLRDRFGRTGSIDDLEAAIRAYQQAVAATPPDSPDLPAILNNLGIGLGIRFGRTGSIDDLDAAIRVYQHAVAATPPYSPGLPGYLNNLGTGLSTRFGRTGQMDDLDAAIRVYLQAVAATPSGSPDLPGHLNNLGIGLRTRFERTGQMDDLEAALRIHQQAVAATPPGSPGLPGYLNNLGIGLNIRFGRNGSLDDLAAATNHYRSACQLGAQLAPQATLNAARNWGRWAMARAAFAEVTEAFGFGLATGRSMLARQLRRTDKETVLRDLQEMAAPCAYAWAKQGNMRQAVVTLEDGRARLMAEALERNRSDLLGLPALGHDALYQRYLDAAATRDQLSQPDHASGSPSLTGTARLDAIRAADTEMDAVIAEIRQIPGYADFLALPTFDQVAAAASNGNVLVYLVTTTVAGLALVVRNGDVMPVWLDGLTDAAVRAWLYGPADDPELGGWLGAYQTMLRVRTAAAQKAWFAAVDVVTEQLWTQVMGPLATALRAIVAPMTTVPEIALVPDGLLALLPLHCAWKGDSTQRHYFLDDFTVRYAPSARALSHASALVQRVGAERLLAVDEPQPVSGNRLPNSAREVAAISGHFAEQTSILQHAKATRAAVLEALPQADVAHFSCHGFNHWQTPLDSGLVMANNEALTVRDLLEQRLPGGRLAVLSACETGIAGTKMPNESVMLSSALLQAGFAGVVASLWSVPDMSTAMLMARFYDLWRGEGMEPAQALRAAQCWLRDTTNREKALYFGQGVPEASAILRMATPIAAEFFHAVTMRGADDEKSFAHPHYWAAFTYTGV